MKDTPKNDISNVDRPIKRKMRIFYTYHSTQSKNVYRIKREKLKETFRRPTKFSKMLKRIVQQVSTL